MENIPPELKQIIISYKSQLEHYEKYDFVLRELNFYRRIFMSAYKNFGYDVHSINMSPVYYRKAIDFAGGYKYSNLMISIRLTKKLNVL